MKLSEKLRDTHVYIREWIMGKPGAKNKIRARDLWTWNLLRFWEF